MYPLQYEDLIRRALLEDLGGAGDLTTEALVEPELRALGRLVARQEGRVAGTEAAATAFRLLDPSLEVQILVPDGRDVAAGQEIMAVRGRARAILSAERVALNLLGRLCGIATATRALVREVEGTRARVVCTRKTTPGLRGLEKHAVVCGGGSNHRFGLDDAVLVKDNHLLAAGGVRRAVELLRQKVGPMVKVEVEVDTLEQLDELLRVGQGVVQAVLLDNFSLADLAQAVRRVEGRLLTEASGNIRPGTAAAIAATGVDLLSVGALTHSSPTLDVGLDLEMPGLGLLV